MLYKYHQSIVKEFHNYSNTLSYCVSCVRGSENESLGKNNSKAEAHKFKCLVVVSQKRAVNIH